MTEEVLRVACRTCHAEGDCPDVIVRGWDGSTYGLACGHDHHFDFTNGGCRTWLVAETSPRTSGGKPAKETERSAAQC